MTTGAKKPRSGLVEGLYGRLRRRVVREYRAYCSGTPPRKALLSYLVHPLLVPTFLRDAAQFSNQGMAREIPRALNELGYSVDIVDYTNAEWQPTGSYDLFIGHANYNFSRLAAQLGAQARCVYFATGVHWRQQNVAAARRLYEIALRRGVLLPPERVSDPSEEHAYERSDGIICLGNQHAAKSFQGYAPVININNAAYPVGDIRLDQKDYADGQKHFLFFSGLGNVHKGLDLLLDAFAGTDLHLHICQHLQPEFARAYVKELAEYANIHLHGFVKMRSPAFERLAQHCNWVILPTCAEGQPGSVLECMAYGLVPILPDAANIDTDLIGYRIEHLEADHIRAVCEAAHESGGLETRQRAERTAALVRDYHSVERFRISLKNAVQSLVGDSSAGAPADR